MRCARAYVAAAAAALLVSSVAAPSLRAMPLDEARIIIEVNATDRDAGIQIFVDGEGWRRLQIFAPGGTEILDITAKGSVGRLGITELFFESEEPSLDEVPLDEFLARFPAGRYRFIGTTVEGKKLRGMATLSHAIPDGPMLAWPPEDGTVDPLNTVLRWNLVADPPGSAIVGYQVIVEREVPSLRVFSVDVSSTTTSVTVPPEFLEPGTEYKWEVLAIEAGGNQTLSESTFETE